MNNSNEVNKSRKELIKLIKGEDPLQILEKFGCDNIQIHQNGARYSCRITTNKLDSISFKLSKNKIWNYTDYSGHQVSPPNGTLFDFYMSMQKCDFETALANLCNEYNYDYISEKTINVKTDTKEEIERRIEKQKLENAKRIELSKIKNDIKELRLVENGDSGHEFLKQRNINNIAPYLFYINYDVTKKYPNKYKNEKNNADYVDFTYNVEGVGVVNDVQDLEKIVKAQDITGADVHKFDKSRGKTASFGPKNITIIPGTENGHIIIESKMCYSAGYSSGLINALGFDFDKENYKNNGKTIILLNGSGNIRLANKYLEKNKTLKNQKNTSKDLVILSQNDKASFKAFSLLIAKANINNFKYIKYNKDEVDFDINDITKTYGDNLKSFDKRVAKGSFQTFINNNEHLFDENFTKPKLKEDIEKYLGIELFELKVLEKLEKKLSIAVSRMNTEMNKYKSNEKYSTVLKKAKKKYLLLTKNALEETISITGNKEVKELRKEIENNLKNTLKENNINKLNFGFDIKKDAISNIEDDILKTNEIVANVLDKIEAAEKNNFISNFMENNNEEKDNDNFYAPAP